jgi:tripartite-type tricarboxylate transporter receptor subunit TctC
MRITHRIQAVMVTLLALFGTGLHAEDFPTKPVRIITPFPPGAGPETVARVVAEKLGKMWGKTVVVENRPGGNGFIAINAFKQGDKDGYDLIQLDNVHLSVYPHLFKKLPYDPKADFEVLAPLFKAAFFFAVPANSPYKSVADIVADAKKQPGKLNYGSWSVGNPVHLGSVLFENMTGTKFEHVVFKETSQLYTSLGNGDLAFALGSYGTSGALQRAGKIRYVAVAGPRRLPAYPDVPTVVESGGPSNYDVVGWTALAAPKGVPPAVAEKIRRDLEKVLSEPDIAQRFATFGYEQFPANKAQLDTYIADESARLAEVIKKAGISLD